MNRVACIDRANPQQIPGLGVLNIHVFISICSQQIAGETYCQRLSLCAYIFCSAIGDQIFSMDIPPVQFVLCFRSVVNAFLGIQAHIVSTSRNQTHPDGRKSGRFIAAACDKSIIVNSRYI